MEIIIYGTKDGHRKLYFKNEVLSRLIANDKRTGASGTDEQLGQSIYSIALLADGRAYTKYIIIRDTLRSFSIGYIAFSVFLSLNESLKGEIILKLLNDLSNHYKGEYIKDNYINKGETDLIIEDWGFIDVYIKQAQEAQKKVKIKSHENILQITQSEKKDPAFVIYEDDQDLNKYFETIFSDYYKYKEVLFIDKFLQEKKIEPLNLLINSGDELKLDLKVKHFYITSSYKDIRLVLKVNGQPISVGNYSNYITENDELELMFITNEKCFKPIKAEGKLSDRKSSIHDYITINDDQIQIKHDAFRNPEEKAKIITFDIKDRKGKPVNDAEIRIGWHKWQKVDGHQHDHKFNCEEIGEKCKVSARTTKLHFSSVIKVDPEHISQIDLPLKRNYFTLPIIKRTTLLIITLLVFSGLMWFLKKPDKPERQQITENEITQYVEGMLLNPDTLKSYKVRWDAQNSEDRQMKHSVFYKLLKWFGLHKRNTDSPSDMNWNKVSESMDSALIKRELIDSLDFAKLIDNTIKFYNKQQKFKSAIISIDESKYSVLKERIVDVKILNLNQIADSIEAILIQIESEHENNTNSITSKSDHAATSSQKPSSGGVVKQMETNQASNLSQKSDPVKQASKEVGINAKTDEIINYIKGDELKTDVLNQYIADPNINKALKKSIRLCLDFWELDGSSDPIENKTYYSFSDNVNNDKFLKKSKLKDFLDKVKNKSPIAYPTDISGAGKFIPLNELYDKLSKTK